MSKILKKILAAPVTEAPPAPGVLTARRIGDFYELFGEDAKIAASVLELTLTTRDVDGEKVPMCGFPCHTTDRCLAKLAAAGYQVTLSDQGIAPVEVTAPVTTGGSELTSGEVAFLAHMRQHGADGYQVLKVKSGWLWDEAFGVKGAPVVYKTKKACVAAIETYVGILAERESAGSNGSTPEPTAAEKSVAAANAIMASIPEPEVALPANVAVAAGNLETAREITGEGKRLSILRPNWEQLCSECIVVRVRVRFWRAAEKLTLKALGLDASPPEFQAFAGAYLKLGQIRLAPARYTQALDRCKQNALNALAAVSFPCPWGGRAAVLKSYPGLREKLEAFREDAQAANDLFVAEYDTWRAELREEYRTLVGMQLALKSGQAASQADLSPEQTENVEALIGALMANIKSAKEIAELFEFAWVPSYVRAPNLAEGGQNLAELEDRVLASQEYLDSLNAKIAAGQASLADETEKAKAEAELAAHQEQLAIQVQVARDVAERAAGEQLKEINGILDGAAARLAGLFYTVAKEVRDSLSSRGEKGFDGATKAHTRKLQEVVEQVRLLNAWADPSVEALAQKLADLATDLGDKPEKYDAGSLDRTLADVQAMVGADLIALGNPEEIEGLEVPGAADVLIEQRAAEAAERLGLVELSELSLVMGGDEGERLELSALELSVLEESVIGMREAEEELVPA